MQISTERPLSMATGEDAAANNGHAPLGYATKQDAATFIGYSESWIEQLGVRGAIDRIKNDGSLFYSLADLRSYREVPKGFISYQEGAERYNYSEPYFEFLVRRLLSTILMRLK